MGAKAKPKRQRKTPERTCVACREKVNKRMLNRLVRTSDHGVLVDNSGKLNGRGAYLCNKVSCWQTAAETDILHQALRTTITDEDRERILAAMPTSQ